MVFAAIPCGRSPLSATVSIPNRGLWFLRLVCAGEKGGLGLVSIPNRGLWFLRLYSLLYISIALICFNP